MRHTRLTLLLIPLMALSTVSAKTTAYSARSEQAEIEAVLRELEYLRERVQALESRFATLSNREKIRFNYRALLEQLRATEAGIRDFLNARIDVIHTSPPQPVRRDLIQVRPN